VYFFSFLFKNKILYELVVAINYEIGKIEKQDLRTWHLLLDVLNPNKFVIETSSLKIDILGRIHGV